MQLELFWPLVILTSILFLMLMFLWGLYNNFIEKKNQVKTDFSDVQVQLKRKADLIEKLMNITKDYAKHEKTTFEDVAKARSAIDTSKDAHEAAQAGNMLSNTLKSLFMVVESNPTLKADQNFLALRADLKETEDAIARYREEYNVTVQDYNNSIQVFPNLLAARLFGFASEPLFQA